MRTTTAARHVVALLLTAVVGAGLAACAPAGDRPTTRLIVGLRPGESASQVALDTAQDPEATVGWVFDRALGGFSVSLPPDRTDDLRDDPRIAFVESDAPVQVSAQVHPTGFDRVGGFANGNLDIDATDDVRVDVDVAVVDSGVDLLHPDLNVVRGVDCSGWAATCGTGGFDDHGHGTHVAGTIGALDNGIGTVGVAPGARIWSVKAMNASGAGAVSNIVAGLDHVAAHADEIEVVNLSLGCRCTSTALRTAVDNLIVRGVVVVVAAGNSRADAVAFSPANHPDVLAVSALADHDGRPGGAGSPVCRAGADDALADFSNFGTTVDLIAPGACILSAGRGGGTATMSGTSMAAPHVSGAAALLASRVKPTDRTGVLALGYSLQRTGTTDWLDTSGDGVTEPLLHVGNPVSFAPAMTGGGTTTPPPAPTPATILLSGTGRVVWGLFGQVTLQWSGAPGASVELFRNGTRLLATANDGTHVDNPGFGRGPHTYQVCTVGGASCSAVTTVAI